MNINPHTKEAYQLFHDGTFALSRAEQQGFRVDIDYVIAKKAHLTRRIDRLEKQFKDSSFFVKWQKSTPHSININSGDQLGNYLYGTLGLTAKKQTKGGVSGNTKGSTDEDSLRELNIPELNMLLERDRLMKARDTYLDAFYRETVNGHIHPFYNLQIARTYRSSSNAPNFQNIPVRDKEIKNICRGALFPRLGHQLLEVDFKGIEVAVNACYNKDPNLIRYVNDPNSDMHGDMAQQIFLIDKLDKNIPVHKTLRQAAKNGFVFPEFYGSYFKNCAPNLACDWGELPKGKWRNGQGLDMVGWEPPLNDFHLANHMLSKGIKSLDQFTDHLKKIEDDFWGNRFKIYAKWKDSHFAEYEKNGYVDLKTGFRCSGVMSKNDVSNYPAQGSAFHCLLWCFIQVDKELYKNNWNSRLIGQIHDSMIFDADPSELERLIKFVRRVTQVDLVEHFNWICVDMNVDMEIAGIDRPWSEKKEFKF